MKKLIILGLVALAGFYGYPDVLGFLGFGKTKYGMSDSDPLGSVAKLHQYLTSSGFTGDVGETGKRRTISFANSNGDQNSDFGGGGILVTVGEEEYVQKIQAVFLSTQRGFSPQRPGPVEVIASDLWKLSGGSSKPKWTKIDEGAIQIPWTVKFGKGIKIPRSHMEASFGNSDVSGKWMYGESTPFEVMELTVK